MAASSDPDAMEHAPEWQPVATGLEFPEGPAWDSRGVLYVSDCHRGRVVRVRGSGVDCLLTVPEDEAVAADDAKVSPIGRLPAGVKTNGLTVSPDGVLFACDFGRGTVLAVQPDGAVATYAAGHEGTRFHRPNDLAFAPDGALYITDPKSYRSEDPDGTIYRIEPEGDVRPAATELAFPNGLAFDADGQRLYVCESARHRVIRFRVEADGGLRDPETFAELPGGDPDGINFDRAGNLYVAHFGGGAVIVLDPSGKILRRIAAPGKKPSNVEFGGDNLETLYLTEVETGAVYRRAADTPGLPLK